MQPLSGLHTSPRPQVALLGVCTHAKCAPVHESSVHPTLSSQSLAAQQLPQLALVLSALGQHSSPVAQRGVMVQRPAWHEPTMHGSSFLHCESSQHSSAQPVVGQHTEPSWQYWFLQKPPSQLSVVHRLASWQGPGSVQATLALQPSVIEQASVGAHCASSGTNMHLPAKQVLVVHAT
jgi:hypothetical protein